MNIPNPPDEITSTIVVPIKGDQLGGSYPRPTGIPKTIGTILTIIGMAVGASVWASTKHDEIKDWTSQQIHSTKNEIRTDIKEKYVEKKDFARVEEKVQRYKDDLNDMKKKIDKMYDIMLKGRRRVSSNGG